MEKPSYIRLKEVISSVSSHVSKMFESLASETKSLINSWVQYILNLEKYLKFYREKFKTLKKAKMLDVKMDEFEGKVESFLSRFSELCLSQRFKKPKLNIAVASTVLSTGNYPFLPKKMSLNTVKKPNFHDTWLFRIKRPLNAVSLSIEEKGIFLHTTIYTAKFLDYSFNTSTRKLILFDFSFKQRENRDYMEDRLMLQQLNKLAMEDRRRNSFELELGSDALPKSDSEPLLARSLLTLSSNSPPWPLSKPLEASILGRGREFVAGLTIQQQETALQIFDDWVSGCIESERKKRS